MLEIVQTSMKRTLKPYALTTGLIISTLTPTTMAEEAFPKTEPGKIEIKELPAGRLLESASDGDYFENSGQLFRPLFNYIQKNGISMTTPVEAKIDPGKMYFWVAEDQKEKADRENESVSVIDIPKRTVAAIGGRGSYSQSNYEEAKQKLEDWVQSNDSITPIGEPYAVYWNGPFTPWFLKTFEVQLQVAIE